MPWARLEDSMWRNRKMRRLPLSAVGLHVLAISYSAEHLTDGTLSDEDLEELGAVRGIDIRNSAEMDLLLERGAWERVETGVLIHDYLQYNPSKEAVLQHRERERKRKSKNGKRGGRPSGSTPRGSGADSGSAPDGVESSRTRTRTRTRTHPVPDPEEKAGDASSRPLDPPANDPFPDEAYLANLDRLRSDLHRRDAKRASRLDPYLRTVLSRSGEFRGLPRRAIRHGLALALEHLNANQDVEHWDRYVRAVVMAEAQNMAAESSQEQADAHKGDWAAAARVILGSDGGSRDRS